MRNPCLRQWIVDQPDKFCWASPRCQHICTDSRLIFQATFSLTEINIEEHTVSSTAVISRYLFQPRVRSATVGIFSPPSISCHLGGRSGSNRGLTRTQTFWRWLVGGEGLERVGSRHIYPRILVSIEMLEEKRVRNTHDLSKGIFPSSQSVLPPIRYTSTLPPDSLNSGKKRSWKSHRLSVNGKPTSTLACLAIRESHLSTSTHESTKGK